MAAKKKLPEEVKSRTFQIRITENERKAIDEYKKRLRRAKRSDVTNVQSNISEIVRIAIMNTVTAL